MHRYPTRFATLNRSYFPADDAEYNPADDAHDESEDYEAYVATAGRTRNSKRVVEADEVYVPETEDNSDEYVANLKGWNVRMGRRPVTRSMTRGVGMQSRVATLRSSRR